MAIRRSEPNDYCRSVHVEYHSQITVSEENKVSAITADIEEKQVTCRGLILWLPPKIGVSPV